ncbi:MAG: PilZ domain-containing protein [Pseudomonadota bacterium]
MGAEVKPLVHEGETQRQYVRVHMPARITIEGIDYNVTDLSSGGLSFKDSENRFRKGQITELLLVLPFPSFSVDIVFKAEIDQIISSEDVVGVSFIDPTFEQLSILNHVLRSFLIGEIVVSDGLLYAVSNVDFAK